MSIMGVFKAVAAAASVLEPQVSKFIAVKREMSELKLENERLEAENRSLKTISLITTILSIAFFVAFMVILVLFLSK